MQAALSGAPSLLWILRFIIICMLYPKISYHFTVLSMGSFPEFFLYSILEVGAHSTLA